MCLILLISLIISTIAWYAFLYYLLYAIKREVNLSSAALILLLLLSLGVVSCPMILYTTILPMYKDLQKSCLGHFKKEKPHVLKTNDAHLG